MTVDNTSGWTVDQWRSASTLDSLIALVQSQKTYEEDPAWIALSSVDQIKDQWDLLHTRPNATSLPLYGVPVAIKDNIDVLGLPTTAACSSFAYTPVQDSTVVSLLRHAGAIIIGKTNLDQFATGLVGTRSPYGVVPNTFDPQYVSGGSSSGSASVVSRGIVPLALGTDTAGSGRVPAMLNNLVGLKPTKGVFSCSGVVPACKSLDCVSIFALSVGDAQTCFDVLAAADDHDPYSRPMPEAPPRSFGPNPKIAVPKQMQWHGKVENEKAFAAAVKKFEKVGDVVEIDITPMLELAKLLYEGPWVAERYAAIKDFLNSNPDPKTLDPTVYEIISGGATPSAATAFEYEYRRQALLKQIADVMKGIDCVVVPTAPLQPKIAEVASDPIGVNSIQGTYTNFVNLADMAGLAIPTGFINEVPFGVTLLGRAFTDYALLELASKVLPAVARAGVCGAEVTNKLPSEVDLGPGYMDVAVVGAHLKGFPLHWQLEKVEAVFKEATTTTAEYRLYALPGGLKPGLRKVTGTDETGVKIALEVYAIPVSKFGEFMAMIPSPLGIGSVTLASGRQVKSFICEEVGYSAPEAIDISSFGGWKNYKRQTPPFGKVLVANRGEIAVRLIRTLKKMGIKSVAVYSDVDKFSQHVLDADEAVALDGVSAADTYINIDKIVAAAKSTGAEAVLPGYGFLSENADFSNRCSAEGIVFVGPSGDAITKLGLKHSAREIAKQAGVPLVPGSDLIDSIDEALKVAADIGYPVMVKSTAGGGGIGLQKVDDAESMERVFATVQHQAAQYFGNAGVFIERFIGESRHVEIQLFGDGKGGALAIGDRDCSLQRRNQKVVEETPAPNIPEATRAKMKAASESLGSLLKYMGAATVEFIYDEKADEFYFLEVNARLQVEHPVTEMVTGLDLVEWMLLLAAGTPPRQFIERDPPTPVGHSIEARVYAENPVKDFMPSPGQLTEVSFPSWCRVDTWVSKGTVVSGEYDPTLAKIIVHGKNRADALTKLHQALDETVIWGCTTNIDYLKAIVTSDMVAAAKMHTKSLDSFVYHPRAFEVVIPGSYTTVQDYPGRQGYWNIGVPPSGCMDNYAFRLANRLLDNAEDCPGLEITLNGPKLLFHSATSIAVCGGDVEVLVNGTAKPQWEVIHLEAGDVLTLGKLNGGCRTYLAVAGGIEVPTYLGSKSTFALGNLGGYNGRTLRFGDVLWYSSTRSAAASSVPPSLLPNYQPEVWEVGVTCGPHGSPDFFKPESIDQFFADTWKVHYNSNRFGVRLIGPKPQWARADGGDAGLHPSNAHDYVYSMGAINFTGDEPVILTVDGPSLGGFVCAAVVCQAEMWKIGQAKPGDRIRFVPVTVDRAVELLDEQDAAVAHLTGSVPEIKANVTTYDPVLYRDPLVCYRQAGDRYILVEFGEPVMDLTVSYLIHRLIEMADDAVGIVEMSRGVRSVLVEYNPRTITQAQCLRTLELYRKAIGDAGIDWKVESRILRLPMAFEDKLTLEAVQRYQETIRSSAPWLPNNVDFLASVNDTTRDHIHDLMYSAQFMVLGLGDVFLGAPCAVPLDPRQRLLGTKYNPSRTYTPNGTVGIGGNYMCIYTMESPGGYQLVGRTVPIWDKLQLSAHSTDPWLLRPFDIVEFYPVTEAEVDAFTAEMNAGKFTVDITNTVFDHGSYTRWLEANAESIEDYRSKQGGERLAEFNRLIQVSNAELATLEAPKDPLEIPEGCEGLYSEFSGRFWKATAAEGDTVTKGQSLVVVEAMKTEMVVVAPRECKVMKIVHRNGDMVEAGDLVAIIE
ncbi:hypothetical protein DIURU_003799 [Diutina rugosa]|uniref:Urea amidolyase n=1 Tax=Diutina rugosa TaxID=5481 RepID=A0A642UJU6_DIURU|nr:uncharacterized protein DIURU_003799 [Diutina rugosa]KAA8900376.1 hypothetical protein DIURU_003799 [Diutina rugosa]